MCEAFNGSIKIKINQGKNRRLTNKDIRKIMNGVDIRLDKTRNKYWKDYEMETN